METLRLSIHDKHIRERRWDIVVRGFQKLEEAFGEELSIDLTTFEPFSSMKKEQDAPNEYRKVHPAVLYWLDELAAEARANDAKFHVFYVDVANKKIMHSVTNDIEEVETAQVDMT